MSLKEDVEKLESRVEETSFAYEILKDYKRSNKMKDVVIFVLIGIIALFVGGLVYVVTNYDFSFEEETVDLSGDNNNYNNNIGGDVHNGD